jgi:putative hydrolase of the HAD superfamily
MSKIDSVIFDWGGVLVDDPRPGLMQYCAKAFGISVEDYIKVHDRFLDDFQKGLVSEEEFWSRVCSQLKKPKPTQHSLWSEAFRSAYSPRQKVLALACKLHANVYKVALLSNTEVPAMQFFYEQGYDVFDVRVFSCMEGMVKPDRKIYEVAVEKLGSTAEQTVFIDDKPDFIKGAEQVGLNTILFKSLDQVNDQLVKLGVKID